MTTTVKERPIIFGAESIRAILDCRKMQTRRVVKPQPVDKGHFWTWDSSPNWSKTGGGSFSIPKSFTRSPGMPKYCPYGVPGDRLWVRETFSYCAPDESLSYRADGEVTEVGPDDRVLWKSPLFMPRWASRILLEVTEVRVERLQSISEEDAIAEGVWQGLCMTSCSPKCATCGRYKNPVGRDTPLGHGGCNDDCPGYRDDPTPCDLHTGETREDFGYPKARGRYERVWDSINGKKPGHAWDDDPFVWAVSFKRVDA